MDCSKQPDVCQVGGRRTQDAVVSVLRDGTFWVFLISMLIVAIVSFFVMRNGLAANPNVENESPPSQVFTVAWIFFYAALVFVCYFSTKMATYTQQVGIYVNFFITMILLVSWVVSFANRNYKTGTIIIILLLILAIILFVQIWMINNVYAFVILFYVIWLCIALYMSVNLQQSQINNSSTEVSISIEDSDDDSPELPSPECSSSEESGDDYPKTETMIL